MKRKKIHLGFVVLVLGIIGFGMAVTVVEKQEGSDASVKGATVAAPQIGLQVHTDSALTQQALSDDARSKGQLWLFTQPVGVSEEFQVSAAYEQGTSLTKLAGVTRMPLREAVMSNVNMQLPKNHEAYKRISQRNLSVNGVEANETIFEYRSRGTQVRQRLLLLFKNSDTVVYIRGQAVASEYDMVNERYFEPLFSSAKFE